MVRRTQRQNNARRRDPARRAAELKKNAQIFTAPTVKTVTRKPRKSHHIKGTARRNSEVLEAGSPQFYASAYTKTWTDAETRRWYSEKRKIVQKRIKRMKESPEYKESKILQEKVEQGQEFLATKVLSTAQIRSLLLPLAGWLAGKQSSLSGYRKGMKQAVQTLNAHGIAVKQSQLSQFGHFMELSRLKGSSAGAPVISGKVAYGFTVMKRMHLNTRTISKRFNAYIDNLETIEEKAAAGEDVKQFIENLPLD